MQGDITHIFKADGTLLVKYVYDAWGNHEGVLDANNAEAVLIANLNPFRYRSYYWDSSIGLYYLNSRYYDSEIGRFINADDLNYLDPESINGLNLYAYCLNNLVCNYDPSGRFVLTAFLIGLIIGVVVGAVVGGVVAYNMAKASGAEGWELFGWTMLGIFGGAVIGGLIGWALGYIAGVAFPAINTFLASTLTFGGGGLALVGAGER